MRPRPGGGYLGRLPTAGVKLWYRVEPYAKVSFRFGVVLWVAGGGGGTTCYQFVTRITAPTCCALRLSLLPPTSGGERWCSFIEHVEATKINTIMEPE
jgi:hypothetical protein